jgi:hypothetical protein
MYASNEVERHWTIPNFSFSQAHGPTVVQDLSDIVALFCRRHFVCLESKHLLERCLCTFDPAAKYGFLGCQRAKKNVWVWDTIYQTVKSGDRSVGFSHEPNQLALIQILEWKPVRAERLRHGRL